MRKLPPKKQIKIAHELALDKPQAEVAKIVGCTQQTVSNYANNEELKKIIHKARQAIITRCLTPAIQNLEDIITSTDPEDKPLKLKYSARVAEAAKALASTSPAYLVQEIDGESGSNANANILSKFGEYLKAEIQRVTESAPDGSTRVTESIKVDNSDTNMRQVIDVTKDNESND